MKKLRDVTVRRYMATQLLTFVPEMEVTDAIRLLVQHQYTGAPVVDPLGRLIGVLSEKDCLRVAVLANVDGISPGLVGDYMVTKVETVDPDSDLLEVATRFAHASYKRLPVVENERLVGQISRFDVLRAIQDLSDSGE